MIEGVIASRYARALLALAKENNQIEVYQKQLTQFSELAKTSPDLFRVLGAKELEAGERRNVLTQVLEKLGCDKVFTNFLTVVLHKGRILLTPAIAFSYDEIANKALGRKVMVVTTAVALSETVTQNLKASFETKLKCQLILKTEVDPQVLGGVRVRIDDQVFDGTFKNQLNKLVRSAA